MKAPILLAVSACLFLAASLVPALSGGLAPQMHRQETRVLLVADARCETDCASSRTRCVSGCAPKVDSGASQCEQGCRFNAGACLNGYCRDTQSACISDCGRNKGGQSAICEQGCGTAYIYCQRKCASQGPGAK